MSLSEIERAAGRAGFKQTDLRGAVELSFMRGASLLNVWPDGRWAFYSEVFYGKGPDRSGSDFKSLQLFLADLGRI